MKTILHTILIITLFAPSIYSAGLKKVLLLDFKNVNKEKSIVYLEASITDAVRKNLKAKFAFKEASRVKWKGVASENFIYERDLYTPTAAMNLGLLAKQDIVIFGGFTSSKDKKGKASIVTSVGIIDVSKRNIISEFKMKSSVDDKIFKSIELIAARIVKEAAAVLPNKEDFARGIVEEDELDFYNQMSLFSGYHAVSLTSSNSIQQNGTISPTDLDSSLAFGFEYQRFGIFKNAISAFGQFEYRLANGDLPVSGLNGTVPATLSGFGGVAGGAYRYFIIPKLYAQAFAGGGLAQNAISLKYSESNIKATNAAGQDESLKEYSTLNPLLKTGIRFGYTVTPWLTLELGGNYNHIFYEDGGSQTVSGEFRVGFFI